MAVRRSPWLDHGPAPQWRLSKREHDEDPGTNPSARRTPSTDALSARKVHRNEWDLNNAAQNRDRYAPVSVSRAGGRDVAFVPCAELPFCRPQSLPVLHQPLSSLSAKRALLPCRPTYCLSDREIWQVPCGPSARFHVRAQQALSHCPGARAGRRALSLSGPAHCRRRRATSAIPLLTFSSDLLWPSLPPSPQKISATRPTYRPTIIAGSTSRPSTGRP
jgi:hypothetical protein